MLLFVPVVGTVMVICVSPQVPMVAGTPPMVTADTVLQVVLVAVGVVHRVPKPKWRLTVFWL